MSQLKTRENTKFLKCLHLVILKSGDLAYCLNYKKWVEKCSFNCSLLRNKPPISLDTLLNQLIKPTRPFHPQN